MPRVGTLDFNSFLDSDRLLDKYFCRYRKQDDLIHLGSNGIFKLSRLIARKILGSPVDGRLYSDVVSAPVNAYKFTPRPRRSVVQS